MTRPFAGYHGGDTMPLGGYAALLGAYNVLFGGLSWWLGRRKTRSKLDVKAGDLLLLGLAMHKLTRTIAKDWVTAPVRAPFTEYQGPSIAGEVSEKSRGRGLRRAVGDLLTCQYCTGPWVAGALFFGWRVAPELTRSLAGIFSAVAISDFLHRAYEASASAPEALVRDKAKEKQASRGDGHDNASAPTEKFV